MKKLKIGVLGAYRGLTMIGFCAQSKEAELVAVCDKYEPALEKCKKKIRETGSDCNPTMYTDFDEFLKHDMDAVVLANYATEHAPFAIRCLNAGKHVLSEVLPAQTLKEAVELVEAVERSGKVYAYAENYCYMPAPTEMRRLYKSGKLGEFQYGEGEYVHDCHDIWSQITYGEENHWRNNAYATFYCTHSLGPIIHVCGLRPVKVVGFELPIPKRMSDLGCKGGLGSGGIEMVTLENGAVIKSFHGCGLIREPSSVWYSMYAKNGSIESDRWGKTMERVNLYMEGDVEETSYAPKPANDTTLAKKLNTHGGGDFYTMYYFIQKIFGREEGENSIDIYEALDMFLPGLMAYKSITNGNACMDVPNFRDKSEREKWRNDTFCTDKKVAGEMYVEPYSKGRPDIPADAYEKVKKAYEKLLKEEL